MSWCDHGHCAICNTEQKIARLRAALQATAARRFPLQGGPSLPWEMIAPYEAQARANHGGQSLERLAERGGLSPCEALAVLTCRPWTALSAADKAGALAEIERRRVEWEDNELRVQLRAAREELARCAAAYETVARLNARMLQVMRRAQPIVCRPTHHAELSQLAAHFAVVLSDAEAVR